MNYSVSKKQARKLNILNDIIIIISYFLKAILCPRLNYYKLEEPFRIQDSYARPQSIKQDDQTLISILDVLPVTRWVKLSLNFELLVPINRLVKLLIGQRLFNI